MNDFYQEGDTLLSLIGASGPIAAVGVNGVSRIEVAMAQGPMGPYAVAQVFAGENEDLVSAHPLHMMEAVGISA